MQSITATELKQKLDNGEDVQIVDVREDSEVAIGRIPNSIHIPRHGRALQDGRPQRACDRSAGTLGLHGKFIEFDRWNYCLVQRRRSQRAQVLTVPRSLSLPSYCCAVGDAGASALSSVARN